MLFTIVFVDVIFLTYWALVISTKDNEWHKPKRSSLEYNLMDAES